MYYYIQYILTVTVSDQISRRPSLIVTLIFLTVWLRAHKFKRPVSVTSSNDMESESKKIQTYIYMVFI